MKSKWSRGLRIAADDIRYYTPNEQGSNLMHLSRPDVFKSTRHNILRDLYRDLMMQLIGKDYKEKDHDIWRVEIKATCVSALFIGMEQRPEIRVPTASDLPMWMQRRLAVLSMLEKAPTAAIEGVGRRMSETVYWVVK